MAWPHNCKWHRKGKTVSSLLLRLFSSFFFLFFFSVIFVPISPFCPLSPLTAVVAPTATATAIATESATATAPGSTFHRFPLVYHFLFWPWLSFSAIVAACLLLVCCISGNKYFWHYGYMSARTHREKQEKIEENKGKIEEAERQTETTLIHLTLGWAHGNPLCDFPWLAVLEKLFFNG